MFYGIRAVFSARPWVGCTILQILKTDASYHHCVPEKFYAEIYHDTHNTTRGCHFFYRYIFEGDFSCLCQSQVSLKIFLTCLLCAVFLFFVFSTHLFRLRSGEIGWKICLASFKALSEISLISFKGKCDCTRTFL